MGWGYQVPILGYHRVGASRGDHVPTVSAASFERQLNVLARHRYQVLTFEAFVEALEQARPVPHRSVVMTFDDGYEETYHVAWPLLKRFHFPATVFIAPREMEHPGFLRWEQIVAMAKDGVTFGSHTMNHSYLPLMTSAQLHEELHESKRVIEEHLGAPIRFFSYPVGGFTSQVQAMLREAGYLAACTTNRSHEGGALDRYALRRIKVTERDRHPLVFRVKLSGYYDCFRQLKDPS